MGDDWTPPGQDPAVGVGWPTRPADDTGRQQAPVAVPCVRKRSGGGDRARTPTAASITPTSDLRGPRRLGTTSTPSAPRTSETDSGYPKARATVRSARLTPVPPLAELLTASSRDGRTLDRRRTTDREPSRRDVRMSSASGRASRPALKRLRSGCAASAMTWRSARMRSVSLRFPRPGSPRWPRAKDSTKIASEVHLSEQADEDEAYDRTCPSPPRRGNTAKMDVGERSQRCGTRPSPRRRGSRWSPPRTA